MVVTGRAVADDMAGKFEQIALNKVAAQKKSADDVFNFELKNHGGRIFQGRDVNFGSRS